MIADQIALHSVLFPLSIIIESPLAWFSVISLDDELEQAVGVKLLQEAYSLKLNWAEKSFAVNNTFQIAVFYTWGKDHGFCDFKYFRRHLERGLVAKIVHKLGVDKSIQFWPAFL